MTIYNGSTNVYQANIGGVTVPVGVGVQLHFDAVSIDGKTDEFSAGEINCLVGDDGAHYIRSEPVTANFAQGAAVGMPFVILLVGVIMAIRGLRPSIDE